jgi:hypothetical protein
MGSILLNPEGHSAEARQQLAPRRFTTLDGATLGLLGNSKLNADNVLAALGELLAERYQLKGIVVRSKPSFSHPAPPPLMDEMVTTCDVVIAGVGD